MEKGKIVITKRFVFTVTSLAVLIFIVIFTIVTFAIKEQSEISNIDTENSVESNIAEEITSDENSDNYDFSDELSDTVFEDISEVSDNLDISEVSDEVENENVFEHGWVINEYGYTYVYNDCGYEQFNYKKSALQRYVNTLNNFASLLPESTRIFSITVPVSSTFADIPREIYVADNFYNQAQSTFVSTVANLTDRRIVHIDIIDALEASYDNGNYVFYRTDKNWTSEGAFLAYSKFCETANIEPLPISSFPRHTVSGFLGSFYNATKSALMKNSPDEFIYYTPSQTVKTSLTVYDNGKIYENYSVCGNKVNQYSPQNVFLGREAERYEIHTTTMGGSLLIVGDESVYPIIPFLTSHYNRIDVINPNRFETSLEDFLENRKYDDCILMCYSTNSISGDYIPTLNSLTGVITDE